MSHSRSRDYKPLLYKKIADRLIDWYSLNKRDLPWRHTREPYPIWISEIILQQTRINQGTDYYLRFLEEFPDVRRLAEAPESRVLKLWQGLGYYTRARNLHRAARQILEEHQGIFPGTYEKILALRGIGPYTAAAIASISFGLPYPVLDGNVIRFLSRLFRIREPFTLASVKNKLNGIARHLMEDHSPGDFNQALMEFGALVCKPASPLCPACPFRDDCLALKHGETGILPVRGKSAIHRNRYFHYLVIIVTAGNGKERILLRKRESKDIWNNLYDFPLVETNRPGRLRDIGEDTGWKGLLRQLPGIKPVVTREYRHILSHQDLHCRFYIVRTGKSVRSKFPLADPEHLEDFPMPRPVEKFLREFLEKKEKKTRD